MSRRCLGMLLCVVSAGCLVVPVNADPLNIWAVGDSTTDGVGDGLSDGTGYLPSYDNSNKPDRRAYRDWLQQGMVNLGSTNYDFIGGRDGGASPGALLPDGSTSFDPDNWGRSGKDASEIADTIVNGDGSVTDVFGGATADVALIALGTNSLNSTPSTVATATADMDTLLSTLQAEYLSGTSRLASDSHLFVAMIIPDVTTLAVTQNTYAYNQTISGSIASLTDATFKSRFAPLVDMFTIDATDMGLRDFIADANGLGTEGEIDSFFSAKIDVDGDNWVDWALGLDESTGDETSLGSFGFGNEFLMTANSDKSLDPGFQADMIHPTDLGYQIMAYQYLSALQSSGLVVPEPTAALVLILGVTGMCLRRRSRSGA